MTFDKQEHKDMVLSLLGQATIPVPQAEAAIELLKAVESASVAAGTKANPDAKP